MAVPQRLEQASARPVRIAKLGKMARREERAFYLFIALWIIGFILFDGGPIVASFLVSFTDWSLLSTPKWVGLANYATMAGDMFFRVAIWNSIYYGVGTVSLGVVTSFLLALLLNQSVFGIAFFRTIFYLPSVVSGIAVAILWTNILHPDFGLINYILRSIGIANPPGWLSSPQWAMPALIMMSLWSVGGSMVIYLAGLQSVPQHLYEAAEIDGAGPWGKFWNVTVPMMSPVIFYNLIVGFIASIQNFVQILIMTTGTNNPNGGGPANATLVIGLYLYRQGFLLFNMGYASALAWVLLLVIILFTAAQFKLAKYWVFYEGDLKR
jgi:multiple sugar transport system permease protein